MYELFVIGTALFGAARWLQRDAQRRDRDPQSQVRSDWLEFLADERERDLTARSSDTNT